MLDKKVEIVIVTSNSDKAENMVGLALENMSEWFGGVTVYDTSGAWLDNNKTLHRDESKTLVSYTTIAELEDNRKNMKNLAGYIRKELNELAVAVTFNGVMEFIED